MAYRPLGEELFSRTPYNVITGGVSSFETAELSDKEEEAIRNFLSDEADQMAKISPKLASDFRNQIDNIVDFCTYFKAKVDGTPYNSMQVNTPNPNEIGLNMLIPQFLGANSVSVDCTAGTEAYLWGSSTTWFKTTATASQRYMIFIIQNGIIHIGQSPVTRQFQYATEKVGYSPFTTQPLVAQSIEEDRLIYQYETPGAFLLTWDLGSRLKFMPEVTASGVEFELIGVVAYEYNAFSSLQWK